VGWLFLKEQLVVSVIDLDSALADETTLGVELVCLLSGVSIEAAADLPLLLLSILLSH
jgi:hypothetical protein